MGSYTKKEQSFIDIVGIVSTDIFNNYYELTGTSYDYFVKLKILSDCLGKSYKVTENEIRVAGSNLSDKALEFSCYQMYITDKQPTWYEGNKIKR